MNRADETLPECGVAEEGVWRLATALARSVTPRQVAEALVNEAAAALGASFGNMAVVEPAANVVRVLEPGAVPPAAPTRWMTFDVGAHMPVCAAIRDGLPVLLGSIEEIRSRYPGLLPECQNAGLSARASVPLYSASGVVLGAVGFGWGVPQDFSATQLRRLDLVAQLAALALERATIYERGPWTKEGAQEGAQCAPSAMLSFDSQFRITMINAEGERLLKGSADELRGRSLLEMYPDLVGSPFEIQYRTAMRTGQPVTFDGYYPPSEGWFEVHAWPDRQGLSVSFSDISERMIAGVQQVAELNEARQANLRLRFLSDLTSKLTGVRTASEVFGRLTRAVVPDLADWCTLVVPEHDQLIRIAAVHRDPALDALAQRLVGTYPHSFDGPSPGVVVYRNNESMRLARLAQQIVADLDDSAASAAYGQTLQLLGDGPGLIMPLSRRGEVVAILTLVRSGGAPFNDADVALMDDVACRVSVALDEAHQVETQRETATALQAASLPKELPTFDHLELAASYRAASEGSQVGGDWYDAFELPSGRIALVVGDAVGHGVQAAALMAQLRNTLRANLFAPFGPAESLSRLSSLLSAQEPGAFATIICAEIDPHTGEVTWSSAGHPAPILVHGDGTSAYLGGRVAPPVGWIHALSSAPPVEHSFILKRADRLLMFTDGLFERRGVSLNIGLTHLMILAEQTHRGADATSACRMIFEDMLARSHEDDACLLIADFQTPG